MRKVLGTVTREEMAVIVELNEKKIAYENLIKIVDINNQPLYEKIVSDYGKVMTMYTKWWSDIVKLNNWNNEGKNMNLDFETNEISIA